MPPSPPKPSPPATTSSPPSITPAPPPFSPAPPAVDLLINPQDFTLTPSDPTLTIATGHHKSTTLTLTSVGNYAGPVTLSCLGPLPQWLTCELPSTPVALAGNSTATIPLTLDTDAILGYRSFAAPPQQPGPTPRGGHTPILLAGSLPLFLLSLTRPHRRRLVSSRRRVSRLSSAAHILFAASLLLLFAGALTGCGSKQPGSTPPGAYTLTIQASGQLDGVTVTTSHTATIHLTVTP